MHPFWRNQVALFRFGQRERLSLEARPQLIYAIGDVHGRLDLLQQLETQIVAHASEQPGEKLIVMLGDYIDKGPESREVITHLIAPPPRGFQRICLAGNHEGAMYDCLSRSSLDKAWLRYGHRTLQSYGIGVTDKMWTGRKLKLMRGAILPSHVEFLRNLPVALSVPGFLFVHAGIRPGISLAHQSDRDLMWIREPFHSSLGRDFPARIVHGHTPVPEVDILEHRINIDTAAFKTNRLTALVVPADGEVSLLQTASEATNA